MREIWRTGKDRLFTGFAFVSGLLVLALLMTVIGAMIIKGWNAISFDFLTQPMREGGAAGGVRDQVLGSCVLLLTTLGIVFPLTLAIALVKSFYLHSTLFKKFFTLFLYTLNGMPSIVLGVFGFFFFVKFLGWGKSWLSGGILLAIMILPVCSLALCEGIERIPKEYIQNAKALGLNSSAIIYSIILPQSLSSFISGLLLGLARAIGETAPIMFAATIFSGATLPNGVKENPILSLPYHIFTLTQESYHAAAIQNAWGSALILLIVVFILNFCSFPFRLKAHEEANIL